VNHINKQSLYRMKHLNLALKLSLGGKNES